MSDLSAQPSAAIAHAVTLLNAGGVIAYPTEYCFGLGCDPQNKIAVQRILEIKRRQVDQGLILIAGSIEHVRAYADLDSAPMIDAIKTSWPGPKTWLLPAREFASSWLTGKHATIAMRLTAQRICVQLCCLFGGAVVSTSANRHGCPAIMNFQEVRDTMGLEVDFILDAPLGGAPEPSSIFDGMSGERIR